MERSDLVYSREDVIENIITLYSYLNGKNGEESKLWAIDKMKRGKNYVIEIINEHVYFAPSRFVGYLKNNKTKHEKNHGDGTQTDAKIKEFYQKIEDERLDVLLQKEISQFDISTGEKKYWIPKDMSVEDIIGTPKAKNYWVGRVTNDHYWEIALIENCWLTQQRYGHQTNSAVSSLLDCVSQVRIGDVILLTYSNGIYAYGNVVSCPYNSDQISNLEEVIKENSHDYEKGIVRFEDNDVFYEDLRDGCDNWGQRIKVDTWHYYNDKTIVTTYGMKDEITKGVSMMSFIGVSESFSLEKIEQLRIQYEKKNMFINNIAHLIKNKHNVILQGAPGTGKTYNTAAIALAVLEENNIDLNNHKAVMERYESLRNKSIFFTTFHQSLDYEDFVEGLKPVVQRDDKGNNVGIVYEPQDGIFKMACNAVETDENTDIIRCIDNYLQSIKGYDCKKKIPTISGKSSLYVWWNEGNKTISTRSTLSTSAKDEEYTPSPLNIEKVKLQAIGEGTENNWVQYAEAFINAVKKEYQAKKEKPVVLIIDEINRGNVSKIFGELITLLESDKRAKSDHPITVTLPYSKKSFSVPDKLYIIGTMNTTDRSTGTLDYALRRRFAFVTLKSDIVVVEKHYDKLGDTELKATAVALFNDIKCFISDPKYLNGDLNIDDLMVGHSYFMAKSREELSDKMQYEVVPLISEYINDGILNVKQEEKKKAFNAWLSLTPIEKDSTEEND